MLSAKLQSQNCFLALVAVHLFGAYHPLKDSVISKNGNGNPMNFTSFPPQLGIISLHTITEITLQQDRESFQSKSEWAIILAVVSLLQCSALLITQSTL